MQKSGIDRRGAAMVDRPNVFSEMTNSLIVLANGLGRELTVPDVVVWLASRDEPLFQADLMRFAAHSWAQLEENKVIRATEVSFRSYCSRINNKLWDLLVEDGVQERKRVVLNSEGYALLAKLRERLDREYRSISVQEWSDCIVDETVPADHSDVLAPVLTELSNDQIENDSNGASPASEVLTGTVPVREVGSTVTNMSNVRQSLFRHLVETRMYLHSDMNKPASNHSKNVYIHYYYPNTTIRAISPYMQVIARAIEYSAREASSIHRQEVVIRKNGSFMMSDSSILEALSLHFKCTGDELVEKMKFYEDIGRALDNTKSLPSYTKYMGRICNEVNTASKLLTDMSSNHGSALQNLNQLQHFIRYMSGIKTHIDTFMHAVMTDQVLNCMRVEKHTSEKLFERLVHFSETYEDP